MSDHQGWHGVDLDGTLAYHGEWYGPGHIGEPIGPMVDLVKKWLENGEAVRIVTARANRNNDSGSLHAFFVAWMKWSIKHFGRILPVTAEKDYMMLDLHDDRAVQVERNTGRIIG